MTIIDESFIPPYCETPEVPESLKNKGEIIQVIKAKLTLADNDGNIYNEVFIIANGIKIFAYNKNGKKVFLPKNGIIRNNDEFFYFAEADGKILLYVEYPGVGIYYDENGKKYRPKGIIEKIEQKFDKITKPIGKGIEKTLGPVVESLINTLHTELIFTPPETYTIPEFPKNKGINKE